MLKFSTPRISVEVSEMLCKYGMKSVRGKVAVRAGGEQGLA